MQGKPAVLATLKAALPAEAGINEQYRHDTALLYRMGVKRVARKLRKYAGDVHAWRKEVDERFLILGGTGGYEIPPVSDPATLTALLTEALGLEMAICKTYEQNIPICSASLDDGTRNLYEHLVKWHQEHIGWFEIQLGLIAGMGEPTYISAKL